MALDIGHILFVQILKMTQYPGSPFTGNIMYDLAMFLLVPSIFLILVVWTITSRLLSGGPKGLGVLLGMGLYIFTIFSGMYAVFALLAGPYFYFLILIYGLLYYFIGHFGIVQQPSELVEVPSRGMPSGAMTGGGDIVSQALSMELEIATKKKAIEVDRAHKDPEGRIGAEIAKMRFELSTMEANHQRYMKMINRNPALKARYQYERARWHMH